MKVLIFPNLNKNNALKCAYAAIDVFISNGITVFIDSKYKDNFNQYNITFGSFENLINDCDIIVTIGGDGTILKCVKKTLGYNKPILGINSGRLGFMASVEADEINLLNKLKDLDYHIEKRMMLSVCHISNNKQTYYEALNDLVIARSYSKISDFKILADDELISNTRSDGLVFSTPTGSTAYSLSAGGPIIEPIMECIEFTPICSHSLFSRTILFSCDKTISVLLSDSEKSDIYFSIDGTESIPFNYGDVIKITKSSKKVRLIDLKNGTFFDSINKKLMQSIKGAD